jgi:hypothetical protein
VTDRILATVTDYPGLIAALRSWMQELGTTMESVDEVCGWQSRHVNKLLAPTMIKTLGRVSMGAVLGALGLKLIVAVDEPVLARMKRRLAQSRWPAKRVAVHRDKLMAEAAAAAGQEHEPDRTPCPHGTQYPHVCEECLTAAQRRALMSELGRQSHAARMARTTPEARQQQASKAASARWKAARRRLREAAAEARA